MASDHQSRTELASVVRREFLQGASWLTGAVVLGSSGALLTACSSKEPETPVAPPSATGKVPGLTGTAYVKGDPGYEAAREAAIWVGNKPKRYPAMIVFPKTAQEVAAAVNFAREQKMKVGVRSGGHSWTASGVQEGSLLIDLFAWNDVKIDAASKTAWVQPGTQAGAFNEALNKQGFAFPTAHASHVSLGGFLICGGFGRHSREWGIGCENVLEVECVNAKGEVLIANELQNQDYYWAARGAGPAFFGIVTHFKVRVHELPKLIHQRIDVYDIADFDALMTWAIDVTPKLAAYVEPMVFRRRLDEKTGGWGPDTISVIAVAMANDVETIKKGFAPLDTCPVLGKRINQFYRDDITLQGLYDRSGGSDPWGWRYVTDGMWTDTPAKQLVPMLRDLYNTPSPRTYIYNAMWGETRKNLPDMAMTIQARSYYGAYVRWDNAADDQKMIDWATGQMKRLEPVSVGSKMNDEAVVFRPATLFSDAALKRLEAMQAKHDPDALFCSFLKPGDGVY